MTPFPIFREYGLFRESRKSTYEQFSKRLAYIMDEMDSWAIQLSYKDHDPTLVLQGSSLVGYNLAPKQNVFENHDISSGDVMRIIESSSDDEIDDQQFKFKVYKGAGNTLFDVPTILVVANPTVSHGFSFRLRGYPADGFDNQARLYLYELIGSVLLAGQRRTGYNTGLKAEEGELEHLTGYFNRRGNKHVNAIPVMADKLPSSGYGPASVAVDIDLTPEELSDLLIRLDYVDEVQFIDGERSGFIKLKNETYRGGDIAEHLSTNQHSVWPSNMSKKLCTIPIMNADGKIRLFIGDADARRLADTEKGEQLIDDILRYAMNKKFRPKA